MSSNWQAAVKMFHEKMGQPAPSTPRMPSEEVRDLRFDICEQEHDELESALLSRDLVSIAQESIDVIITALGNLVACGIDADEVFQAVMTANMQKEPGPDGGKAVKPEGWEKPDIRGIVERQMQGVFRGDPAPREWGDAGDEHEG